LVGLKSDLKTDPATLQQLSGSNQKPISFEQGVELRNHIRSIKYLECSSRTGEGVTEVFQAATKACLKQPKLKVKFGSCMLL
jgi:Ras family protein A